jgi:hypothetical protein
MCVIHSPKTIYLCQYLLILPPLNMMISWLFYYFMPWYCLATDSNICGEGMVKWMNLHLIWGSISIFMPWVRASRMWLTLSTGEDLQDVVDPECRWGSPGCEGPPSCDRCQSNIVDPQPWQKYAETSNSFTINFCLKGNRLKRRKGLKILVAKLKKRHWKPNHMACRIVIAHKYRSTGIT